MSQYIGQDIGGYRVIEPIDGLRRKQHEANRPMAIARETDYFF